MLASWTVRAPDVGSDHAVVRETIWSYTLWGSPSTLTQPASDRVDRTDRPGPEQPRMSDVERRARNIAVLKGGASRCLPSPERIADAGASSLSDERA